CARSGYGNPAYW
nr:immunoglobulin heavy chain junction region [Mus musculus]